jgi:hypothetical protein
MSFTIGDRVIRINGPSEYKNTINANGIISRILQPNSIPNSILINNQHIQCQFPTIYYVNFVNFNNKNVCQMATEDQLQRITLPRIPQQPQPSQQSQQSHRIHRKYFNDDDDYGYDFNDENNNDDDDDEYEYEEQNNILGMPLAKALQRQLNNNTKYFRIGDVVNIDKNRMGRTIQLNPNGTYKIQYLDGKTPAIEWDVDVNRITLDRRQYGTYPS